MKIAIDISPIVYGTGVSVYTKNLIHNILKYNNKDKFIFYGCSLRRRQEIINFFSSLENNNFESKVFPLAPTLADFIWNRLHIIPIERIVGDIDLFHSSDWTQPPSKSIKITTVHDLVPVKYPKLSDPKLVSVHKARLKWVLKEVDRVIVPSQTTAKDFEHFGYDIKRIRIISEAPDPIFKPADEITISNIKRKYRISGDYIISVGVGLRKNSERIISAYEKLKGENSLKLVFIGHQFINMAPPRGVIFLGHIPFTELPILYSGAKALVYPSLYEGFGLPILEAYSCKIPVVTSNLGSMREIADDAAVLVDPYNSYEIAEGIKKALNESQNLIKRGLKRLEKFSWEKSACKTLEVYQEFEK